MVNRLPRRAVFGAAVGAVALLAAAHALYYFPRAIDDMYIFLRYAENLVRGEGLVYNPGERVEGFSSPLWVALLAAGMGAGAEGVAWSKVLALGSFGALLAGLYRFGRERLEVSRPVALAGCCFAALNSYLVSWSLWGLETPAYLALMVWTAVLFGRVAGAPSRGGAIALAAVGGAFSLSRPEAPLFLAAIGAAAVVEPLRPREMLDRLRRLAPSIAGIAAVFAAYLAFRRLYYGLWLPNTGYAKHGSGFAWSHLEPLWAQGASWPESALLWGGAALAIALAAVRRTAVPLAVAAASVWFTGSVTLDWMPNIRHLLPIYLFLPLGWLWVADRAARVRRPGAIGLRAAAPGALLAALAAAPLFAAGLAVARIDSRLSPLDFPTHGGGRNWILPKTAAKWRDAWMCLRRETPPHVRDMDPFHMGMIAQVYRLLESDARPLDESWYVGRDIGRVGWLAPVKVFDTDGLFTRAVVEDPGRRADGRGNPRIAAIAMDRPVVMTELMGGWGAAAWSVPAVRARYRPLYPWDRAYLVPRDAVPPSAAEIVARYERAAARMPRLFFAMTLYGEAVGAAIERRLAIVRRTAADNPTPTVSAAPEGLAGAGVTLDGLAELLGCSAVPERVAPGEEVLVTCWFRVLGATERRYRVFLHFEGQGVGVRFLGDHDPAGGFHPTDRWRPGEIVRDAWRVTVPASAPAGDVRVFIGLFEGDRRAGASHSEAVDAAGRVPGPMIRIAR